MKKKYFLIMIVLGLCSCQKEISHAVAGTPVDVYVAGYVSDDGFTTYATYWKNGGRVILNSDSFPFTRALSIAVSGNDVYVGGDRVIIFYQSSTLGTLWKNGAIVELENSSTSSAGSPLISLAVSGNDVYALQKESQFNVVTYWKNSSLVNLNNGSTHTMASSIFVSGRDVYVAGTQYNGTISINGGRYGIATYWKNGSPVNITDGSKDAAAKSIAVSGNDVYVVGYEGEDGIAKYWRNGSPVNLTDGLTGAEANSIAISGSDVYVAGAQWDGKLSHNAYGYEYLKSIAKYWKNGNPVNLTDGTEDAEANSIAVSGNDVYVTGHENNVAKYWKNGSPVILGDVSKYSEAYSVFLVKH